jgi:hypothetical protein
MQRAYLSTHVRLLILFSDECSYPPVALGFGQYCTGFIFMPYARKIILHTPLADPAKLDSFVEACLAGGVALIAVIGPDSDKVEDLIDEIVVGDGSDESRFVVTSSHRDETLEEVLEFVSLFSAGPGARIEQVKF